MLDVKKIIEQSKHIKVLYVEDNKEARESTVGLLKNIFTNITTAIDGKDGLDKFFQEKSAYDLIISDINMPKVDGIEMVSRIKEVKEDVRVCLLSAYDESEYPLSPDLKIDARLSKPINFDKLLTKLDKIYSTDINGLSM